MTCASDYLLDVSIASFSLANEMKCTWFAVRSMRAGTFTHSSLITSSAWSSTTVRCSSAREIILLSQNGCDCCRSVARLVLHSASDNHCRALRASGPCWHHCARACARVFKTCVCLWQEALPQNQYTYEQQLVVATPRAYSRCCCDSAESQRSLRVAGTDPVCASCYKVGDLIGSALTTSPMQVDFGYTALPCAALRSFVFALTCCLCRGVLPVPSVEFSNDCSAHSRCCKLPCMTICSLQATTTARTTWNRSTIVRCVAIRVDKSMRCLIVREMHASCDGSGQRLQRQLVPTLAFALRRQSRRLAGAGKLDPRCG